MKIVPGGVTAAKGFRASGVFCGIKKKKSDLALVVSDVPASAAGLFTSNRVKAAPLLVARENLRRGKASAIIVNSGNANACTGNRGIADALAMARQVSETLKVSPGEVVVASTGVIGVKLPIGKIIRGISRAFHELNSRGGHSAAEAIRTTDTFAKEFAVRFNVSGKTITIGGMTKGAGMIHPHLATMLCFITSDADISPPMLKAALKSVAEQSFNSITVDGDTSTNDTLVVLANGLAGNKRIVRHGRDFVKFRDALKTVAYELAKMIVRDGEGSSKLIEVVVSGAQTGKQATAAAKAIAGSNLVKTAVYGADPNWGRVMAALGRSGTIFEPCRVDISFNGYRVVRAGTDAGYDEKEAHRSLTGKEIKIEANLHAGSAMARVWTCDLTEDYIKINAHYRT